MRVINLKIDEDLYRDLRILAAVDGKGLAETAVTILEQHAEKFAPKIPQPETQGVE